MAAMHDDVWDEQAQDWMPDAIDRQARAIIDYRDRIAASVDGPVPTFGTPEWAAADPQTQAAAAARHERDVAAAQGAKISNRMAAEAGERSDHAQARQEMSAMYTRRRYAHTMMAEGDRVRREAQHAWRQGRRRPSDGVPAPRRPVETSRECLQRDSSLEAAAAEARQAVEEATADPVAPRAHTRRDSAAVNDVAAHA
jgi:hypothetical protein